MALLGSLELSITKMKTISVSEPVYLNMLARAIQRAVSTGDTQMIFDGEDFHIEEIVCKEFIRGYLIFQADYVCVQVPEERRAYHLWLEHETYIHAGAIWASSFKQGVLIQDE